MEPEEKDLVEKNGAQEQPKKPYATPKLTVHGNVEKITSVAKPSGSGDGLTFSAVI